MRIIADLHIHSKYSQATSKNLDIPNLEKYARIKGINLLGTGDFTHPKWIKEIQQHLTEDKTGFLKTATGFNFVLSTEVSLIYSQGGKGRRIHNLVLAPDLDTARRITEYLLTKGRVDYDGRPIFKIPCPEFVKSLKSISNDIEIIPAHIWTPWFSLFGSKSGFDSIKECFLGEADKIRAIETGLSSNPEMNWQVSQLDDIQILSFSDSHSYWPWRMGREATIFDIAPSYEALLTAIRTGEGLLSTIEVDPNYGKYHYDGHRNCQIVFSPEESKRHNNICPVCKKALTIGVMYRAEQLADRTQTRSKAARPYHTLVPLAELIAAKMGSPVASKKVTEEYYKILGKNTEFAVMLDLSREEILRTADGNMTELILKNREGNLFVKAGYDGVYGELVLGMEKQESNLASLQQNTQKVKSLQAPVQKGLGDFFGNV